MYSVTAATLSDWSPSVANAAVSAEAALLDLTATDILDFEADHSNFVIQNDLATYGTHHKAASLVVLIHPVQDYKSGKQNVSFCCLLVSSQRECLE